MKSINLSKQIQNIHQYDWFNDLNTNVAEAKFRRTSQTASVVFSFRINGTYFSSV